MDVSRLSMEDRRKIAIMRQVQGFSIRKIAAEGYSKDSVARWMNVPYLSRDAALQTVGANWVAHLDALYAEVIENDGGASHLLK